MKNSFFPLWFYLCWLAVGMIGLAMYFDIGMGEMLNLFLNKII